MVAYKHSKPPQMGEQGGLLLLVRFALQAHCTVQSLQTQLTLELSALVVDSVKNTYKTFDKQRQIDK